MGEWLVHSFFCCQFGNPSNFSDGTPPPPPPLLFFGTLNDGTNNGMWDVVFFLKRQDVESSAVEVLAAEVISLVINGVLCTSSTVRYEV